MQAQLIMQANRSRHLSPSPTLSFLNSVLFSLCVQSETAVSCNHKQSFVVRSIGTLALTIAVLWRILMTDVLSADPTPGQWDCRSFNLEAYQQEVLDQRADFFSSVYATCFIVLPGQDANSNNVQAQDATAQVILAAAYSTGIVRLFKLRECISGWLAASQLAMPAVSWQAHDGSATCCSVIGQGNDSVLVTAGTNGQVQFWRLMDLLGSPASSKTGILPQQPSGLSNLQHASSPNGVVRQDLKPFLSIRISSKEGASAWGVANQPLPAVNCLVVDQSSRNVFLGMSDGGVHMVSVDDSFSHISSNLCGSHLAGVLSMDIAPGAGLLATGGEDGMVRLWNIKQQTPTSILCPCVGQPGATGTVFPPSTNRSTLSAQVKFSPAVVSLKFSAPDCGFLLIGCAGTHPTLTTWSINAEMVTNRINLPCAPQVLGVLPSEVMVAGTGLKLYKYSFAGELISTHKLSTHLTSVLSLNILEAPTTQLPIASDTNMDTGSHQSNGHVGVSQGSGARSRLPLAPGAVALGGAYGCVDVLSHYGTKLLATNLVDNELDFKI